MSAKLDNSNLVPKTYWSIVSRFLNKSKIPTIPPVLVNGKLFQVKYEHFNFSFATQCTPFKTSSKLSKLKYKSKNRLYSFAINVDEIFLMTKNLMLIKLMFGTIYP